MVTPQPGVCFDVKKQKPNQFRDWSIIKKTLPATVTVGFVNKRVTRNDQVL